jgi:antitoxin component YwqK of YwqJK toxin-antitoxin module
MQDKTINQYNDKFEKHGPWEHYWQNGNLMHKGEFKDGQRVGYWEIYNRNGSLRYNGIYNMNKCVGLWKTYYPDGTLHKIEFYAN